MVILTYNTNRSKDGLTYLIYLHSVTDCDDNNIVLPDAAYDILNSFTTRVDSPENESLISIMLMKEIQLALSSLWDFTLGAPVVKLRGQTSKLDKYLQQTYILPAFYLYNNAVDVVDQYNAWTIAAASILKHVCIFMEGNTIITTRNYTATEAVLKQKLKEYL